MKKILNKLKSNQGITGADIAISVIVIVVFTGVISGLMYNSYANGVRTEVSSNASWYATVILEKVDEKPFDEVTSDFISNLIANNELEVESRYTINFKVEDLTYMYKKVTVTISYSINKKQEELTISKLKVNESGV